jgi:glucuronokinase
MTTAEGSASARAALAGNPSDGYGGAVLAVTLDGFSAHTRLTAAEGLTITPDSELVRATVERFSRRVEPRARRSAISWETNIPRSVGLGGSSAIVIATLRALCALYERPLQPVELARFALAVETEELAIAAGLQDRIAQSFGGLTFMEFAGPGAFEPLTPQLLPPLLIAWQQSTAAASGTVHEDLRSRHASGEPEVLTAVDALADSARSARAALLAGDHAAFARAVDATFDTRRRLLELDPRHVMMVECAREHGAAANYTGSGGAIVAVCRDAGHQIAVMDALSQIGCACSR